MTLPLPPAFVRRMTAQLGPDAPAYLAAMEEPALRGLRQNPLKTPDAPLAALVAGLGEPLPWAPNGFLLAAQSDAGALPLHEAGAYYVQEPSAMIPAAVLDARPGETVLDLCAAPGGKSTQLAAAMAGRGTLVCNEIVPARAQVLSRNLERMGVANALAVCADPAKLAQAWPSLFDAVLVDAPCSGEGMFRRHPETRLEWDENAPARCARRQAHILESACAMLRPGGRLCYATCTLNREENEDTVAALLAAHPELEPVSFSVPVGPGESLPSLRGGLHLYPHEIAGEGHFVALLRKTRPGRDEADAPSALLPAEEALEPADRPAADAFAAFWADCDPQAARPTFSQAAGGEPPAPVPNASLGDTLLCAPPLPPLRGIRVLRAGLALGQLKGKVFAPDHALAMAAPPCPLRGFALSDEQARAYLRGEALPAPETARGYGVVTTRGLALGFVKASDGWLKNHYPKGLRRP